MSAMPSLRHMVGMRPNPGNTLPLVVHTDARASEPSSRLVRRPMPMLVGAPVGIESSSSRAAAPSWPRGRTFGSGSVRITPSGSGVTAAPSARRATVPGFSVSVAVPTAASALVLPGFGNREACLRERSKPCSRCAASWRSRAFFCAIESALVGLTYRCRPALRLGSVGSDDSGTVMPVSLRREISISWLRRVICVEIPGRFQKQGRLD